MMFKLHKQNIHSEKDLTLKYHGFEQKFVVLGQFIHYPL